MKIIIALIPLFVMEECSRPVVVPLPAGGGGGGGYSAPAPAQRPLAPGPSRIDDPDRPINGQIIDYVWGGTIAEAERNCRTIAAQAGLTFKEVRRTSQKGKKWECHVLSNHPETEPSYGQQKPNPATDDRIRDPNGRR